jgi:hypothetical protein
MSRDYRMRYTIEGDGPYSLPEHNKGTRIQEGLRVSDTDYGYADDVLLVSIMRESDGSIESMLLLTSEDGRDPRRPSPELLREVRAMIDHYLETHA